MIADLCDKCGRSDHPDIDWNYTYNCSPMWHEAIPDRNQMIDIDGLSGKQALQLLEKCVNEMISRPEDFIKLNPKNGWGSYDTFLRALEKLITYSKEYPNAIWKSCR